MLRSTYDPREQATTPGTGILVQFLQILIVFVVTKASGGGGLQNVFSFLSWALKKFIEKHCHLQHMPYTQIQLRAQEFWRAPLGQNSCLIIL